MPAQIADKVAEPTTQGWTVRAEEPRATSARYEPGNGRVVVELDNGCTFAFPARSVQGLEQAEACQIAQVELLGSGYGLHWETLDVDISVPGLLRGVFGTAAHMAARSGRPGPAAPARPRRKSA